MFFFICSVISININDYIDGLEYLPYDFNQKQSQISIRINKNNLFLFFKNSTDIRIDIKNQHDQLINLENGQKIPKNSVINIKADWNKYKDYIVGIINGQNCDYFLYSFDENDPFQFSNHNGKKLCFYQLTKNSKIKNQVDESSPFSFINMKFDDVLFKYYDYIYTKDTKIFVKKDILKLGTKKNIMDEPDEEEEEGPFYIIMCIVSLSLGVFLYWVIGLTFGSRCGEAEGCCWCFCRCECCQRCNCADKVDNRENEYFSKTMRAYGEFGHVEEEYVYEKRRYKNNDDNQNDDENPNGGSNYNNPYENNVNVYYDPNQ